MPSRPHRKPDLKRHFLKEWRDFRGLDQETAAERIGISRTQLSKIENMRSPYMQGLMQNAAFVYQCSEADLIERNPLDDDTDPSLMDQIREAPESTRQQIRAIVAALIKTSS